MILTEYQEQSYMIKLEVIETLLAYTNYRNLFKKKDKSKYKNKIV